MPIFTLSYPIDIHCLLILGNCPTIIQGKAFSKQRTHITMLNLEITRDGKQPLYQQIAEQIKTQISNGRLPANTRLPTIRKMAATLSVTRLTVQNAYGELQADGWIEATVGRGTFVSPAVQRITMLPSIGQYLTPDNAINDMIELDQVIGVRSMALAIPDSSLFPTESFWQEIGHLRSQANDLMGYGPILGDAELRVEVVQMLAEMGITAVPENILITSGALQAVSLTTQAITEPGENVLVDSPTFLGMLNVLEAQRLNPIHVPYGEDGPDLDVFEQALRTHHPRFYYAIPNFHNPTGYSMSVERRQAVLQLTSQYNCMILEDDIYGQLAYDDSPLPTFKSQDKQNQVIYVSGFSKVLMPGLRVGYLVMPPRLRTRLQSLRRATDLCSPIFVQRALANFLRRGGLKQHLKRIIPIYRDRRDTLMSALRENMPPAVTWSRPAGGFSNWVTLPRYFAGGELYRQALQQGFAFTPGEAYQINDDSHEFMRLCFANQSSAGIRASVTLLGNLIKQQIDTGGRSSDWMPVV